MKPSLTDLLTIPRVCAFILNIVGTGWAMIVGFAQLMALAVPREGLLLALYHLPGWIVYFGWLTIAKGDRPGPLSNRTFWILSTVVNLGYLAHKSEVWKGFTATMKPWNPATSWWLITGVLSAVCIAAPERPSLQ
jgi:hypothetical protein